MDGTPILSPGRDVPGADRTYDLVVIRLDPDGNAVTSDAAAHDDGDLTIRKAA